MGADSYLAQVVEQGCAKEHFTGGRFQPQFGGHM
jgi:hypothetical protein